jgi:OOP family OmpA-OmpF porin
MSARKLCPLALALAFACTAASAQQADRGWYVGLSIGSSKAKFESGFPEVPGATASSQTKDEQGTPYKVYLGYQINRNFALEGGWTDLGKFDASRTVTTPFVGSERADWQSSGAHLDAVGILPAGNFAAFFKLGVIATKTKTDLSVTGGAPVPPSSQVSTKEVNGKFGVGMSYAFTPQWAARLEYDQVNNVGDRSTGEVNVRMWSAGITHRF